MNKSLPLFP
ncbi:hypothetical protein CGLO_07005 [Colletotrichum gloeosporioides Cg-14]|uniref:Uncharacterized protein n=1 Tax=Colletotrichum gloeosporioides (strain Cg-14) TaxID=1237896 RepID=T0KCX9_COLGC|nr:hypothetical protein CGLO_07005 [Colletotrichum gloeosporioides Cg-14]